MEPPTSLRAHSATPHPIAYPRSTRPTYTFNPLLLNRHSTTLDTSYETLDSTSAPSSVPSPPQLAHTTLPRRTSSTSTLASSLSLASKKNDGETDFPSFQKSGPLYQLEVVPDPAPKADEHDAKPTTTAIPGDEASQSDTKPKDDQAMEREPACHADYLAHEWKLEDIWSSWRYVVARRRVYSDSARLENASWRMWAKAKDNLRTISPESINW